jgi:hypothetical protein
LSSEHLFQFDIVTEVTINALSDASLYIFSGDSQNSLLGIDKLTGTEGTSGKIELKIEDG